MTKKVGVIGLGYWGPNLVRCFNDLGALHAIADQDEKRLYAIAAKFNVGNLAVDIGGLWALGCDAIAIATPPETHYAIAVEALNAGKDVFIEKPMTTRAVDAEALVKQAEVQGCNLMVGHIYLHNGGIKLIPVPAGKAELYVQLLNEGGSPSESTRDVIWAGLPHAVSLALRFFPDWPEQVTVKREADRIKVILWYWNGSVAYLDVGDNTGRKLRKVELRLPDRRYSFDVASPNQLVITTGWTEVLHSHSGDISQKKSPEPLMEECQVFLEYQGIDPLGAKVVKLTEEILDECKP